HALAEDGVELDPVAVAVDDRVIEMRPDFRRRAMPLPAHVPSPPRIPVSDCRSIARYSSASTGPRPCEKLPSRTDQRAGRGEDEHMRFGLFGSAQARRGAPDVDSGAGFRDFVENNVEAEALGYHSTFIVEHHFTGFGQISATLNLLTWVGARTTTLRLGTAVIVLAWHNPVLLAEQAATIDLLSGGRLDFGIGKGYRYNEFSGFATPMEEADARFDESLEVMLKAWTSDSPWSHRGRYWQFDDVVVEPPTAQKPHPPLWVGAGSPARRWGGVLGVARGWPPAPPPAKPPPRRSGWAPAAPPPSGRSRRSA